MTSDSNWLRLNASPPNHPEASDSISVNFHPVTACVTPLSPTKSPTCVFTLSGNFAQSVRNILQIGHSTAVHRWAHNGMDDLFIFRLELNYVYMSITDVYLLFTVGDKFGLKSCRQHAADHRIAKFCPAGPASKSWSRTKLH